MSTGVPDERALLEAAIAALTGQRALLGDAVVDVAIAPLEAKLAVLAKPQADASPEQSLRLVTIVFLDVVGSTTLSQHLDPEDIHALIDGTLERCTSVVTAHGGRVLQYAGDSLLAVFGFDGAREDDAERAVRAGLALLDEGRLQQASVREKHRWDGFDVRIGAHTGPVLLGGGVDADASIRGAAVNIAARMEQTAPPGTLRISRDTWRQVRDCFEVEAQSPLAVKGIDEPIATYLVVREKPRAFDAASTGIDPAEVADADAPTAMIGRDIELERVTRSIDDARQRRSLHRFTVVADAGMGKSRFLREVEQRLGQAPGPLAIFRGRAQRHGAVVPHGLLRDLLAWHCEIRESDASEVARAKLVATFGAVFGERAGEQAALVGQLVGFDFSADPHIAGIVHDGRQIRGRAFHAVAEFVRRQCAAHALVVLLLDDLHWADDGSFELIEHVASACADLPVVIGSFARPALDERRPHWTEGPRSERIELSTLDDDDGGRLVDALLGREFETPPELRTLILAHAGGNPFHIQELLGMLVDDGVVARTVDGWQVDRARLGRTKVPPTLTAVLQARLDALPQHEKLALQHDSVVGQVFWDEALRAIAPGSVAALEPLLARALIYRHADSVFAATREYQFKHHLLHQVTYETVLKGAKRDLHRRTADWLVGMTGERIGEHLGLIAGHFERAGDPVEAARFLARAAKAAYRTAAFGAAIDDAGRALTLIGDADLRTRFDLHATRCDALNSTGRRVEQADDVAAMAQCAEALDDDRCRARAARNEALLAVVTGDYGRALDAAARALALGERCGDVDTVVGAMLERGQALIFTGRSDEAEACLRSVLELTAAHGLTEREVVAHNRINAIAQARGDFAAATVHLERALALSREANNRRFEGALVGNLGVLHVALGRFDRAREEIEAGLAVARQIGDRGSEPYGTVSLAEMELEEGRAEIALEQLVVARALSRQVGDLGCEKDAVIRMVEALDVLGRVDEALACCDEYDALGRSAGRTDPASLALRALLEMKAGRPEAAEALAVRVAAGVDELAGSTNRFDRSCRMFVCYHVAKAAGRADAESFLVRAHASMMAVADALDAPDRVAYLQNLRWHRAIAEAWAVHAGRT